MILEKTLKMLKDDPRSLEQIARDCDVGYSWLAKLNGGFIPDPGIKRLEKLHNHLKNWKRK